MNQASDAAWVRLSSRSSSDLRWLLPFGYLSLTGLWILFADLSAGGWQKKRGHLWLPVLRDALGLESGKPRS